MVTLSHLLFIGAVEANAPGGATVKNALLIQGLMDQGVAVSVLDTGPSSSSARLRQYVDLMRALGKHDQIILSVSSRGTILLVILLALVSVARPPLKVVLIAVGSSLPANLRRRTGVIRLLFEWGLSKCQRIYVQGRWLAAELFALGFTNVDVIPNPRQRGGAKWSREALREARLMFASRIIAEKGIGEAMEVVERLRAEGVDVSLDVYGPIDDQFRPEFTRLLELHPGTSYLGVLDAAQVSKELASHAALLLPTRWASEGTPGIIVEAGMVGMPVVTSNSVSLAELIDHGSSGLLVDPSDVEAIADAVRHILSDADKAERLGATLQESTSVFELGVVTSNLSRDLVALGWR